MKKSYEKHIFESYKDMIENLTVDRIKQKLTKFEKYCEEKLNCEELEIRFRYDQISAQYYLSYSVVIPRLFRVAKSLQNYLNKIQQDFQYIFVGVHPYNRYSGGKVEASLFFIDTMVSENWLKQHMPEYLNNFRVIGHE